MRLLAASRRDAVEWALAEAGLLTLAVPERLGGDGLGVLEVAALLTEVGRGARRRCRPATLGLGVLPRGRAGGRRSSRTQLLPGVADGGVLTAALSEPGRRSRRGRRPPRSSMATVSRHRARGRRAVRRAGAPDPGAHATPGSCCVDPAPDGVTLDAARRPPAEHPEFTVRLDGASGRAAAGRRGRACRPAPARARRDRCASATGCWPARSPDRRALRDPRTSSAGRWPTFQAVAQQIADVYIAVPHPAPGRARGVLAAGRQACDADDDLDVAAYWLASEAPAACSTCHHLHGGLGLDVTYPLHRYYSHCQGPGPPARRRRRPDST